MPRTADFKRALEALFVKETERGVDHVIVRSGDLHRRLGGYPGQDHAMPTCCNVLYAAMGQGDKVLRSPPKGQGANVVISYRLPR